MCVRGERIRKVIEGAREREGGRERGREGGRDWCRYSFAAPEERVTATEEEEKEDEKEEEEEEEGGGREGFRVPVCSLWMCSR
jgi:hypothetical protein